MTATKKSDAIRAMCHGIWRQYPTYGATFSQCMNGCDGMGARDGGRCVKCYERELAQLTSIYLASEYHQTVRRIRQMEAEMVENVDNEDVK